MIRHLALSLLFLIALSASLRGQTVRPGLQNCLSGASPEQRRLCDEEASKQVKAGSKAAPLDGGWRLVRTEDPGSGAEVVSVMHTVNTAKSDPGLAGLSLRCGQDGVETVLIVLEPLLRTSRPKVALTAGANRTEFEASVIQGGEAILLPQAASRLAAGAWQNEAELSIEIPTKQEPIRGTVPIGGLSAALRSLSPDCAVK